MCQSGGFAAIASSKAAAIRRVSSRTSPRRSPVRSNSTRRIRQCHPSSVVNTGHTSNGAPDVEGDAHCAVSLEVDRETRALRCHGPEVPLPSRPIHVTVMTEDSKEHDFVPVA